MLSRSWLTNISSPPDISPKKKLTYYWIKLICISMFMIPSYFAAEVLAWAAVSLVTGQSFDFIGETCALSPFLLQIYSPWPNFPQFKHLSSYLQEAPLWHLPLSPKLSCLSLSFNLKFHACCSITAQLHCGCLLMWIQNSLSYKYTLSHMYIRDAVWITWLYCMKSAAFWGYLVIYILENTQNAVSHLQNC